MSGAPTTPPEDCRRNFAGASAEADGLKSQPVDLAADWLRVTPPEKRPHPIIPHLHRTFGLSAGQACAAIREASTIRARAE
ncbi:hypothetical protein [Consotaella aegiceratis]|uniref:hypothetical protein n=1 Tax=Consotaella aegiceratis TaxID=3097961 RepID=UPI002F40E0E9